MAAMFTGSTHHRFNNTSFTINNHTNNFIEGPGAKGQALGILYGSVAPNAILNAGGRSDEVRCHPGTRKEVIGLIDTWRDNIQNNVMANQMFWLSGPAGAGKTAIVQTVAEKWKSAGVHTANFFFFRTDPSRSHAESFVSTLLYQIFDFFPAARDAVDRVLTLKPRILEAGLEEQVDELICSTFRSIQPPFPHKIVLLVDGLDECDSETKDSQNQILQVLDQLVGQDDLPFLVLVASRAEPHISAAFTQLTAQAQSIFLDEKYSPEEDIHAFVTAKFKTLKKSHPHAARLKSNWPSAANIDAIVRKSSGQFIYAATIMRFLAQSSAVPSLNLEKVEGIVPCAKNSPFVHLDAVYTYILHHADDHQAMRDILSSALLRSEVLRKNSAQGRDSDLPPIQEFLQLYDSRYTESLFTSCISDISSIAQVHDGRLVFYHASFSDFLLDQFRSGMFHININEFTTNVLPRVWKYPGIYVESIGKGIPLGLRLLCYVQHPTPAITKALLTELPSDWDEFQAYIQYGEFLENISRLYYARERKSYKQILKRWIICGVSTCDSDKDLQIFINHCRPMTWLDGHTQGAVPLLRRYLLAARIQKQVGKAVKIFKH